MRPIAWLLWWPALRLITLLVLPIPGIHLDNLMVIQTDIQQDIHLDTNKDILVGTVLGNRMGY